MESVIARDTSTSQLEFEIGIYGNGALFTNPLTKTGGEKSSYPVPTYGALKGLIEQIYWKPTFIVSIDAVRVMNNIKYKHRRYSITNFHRRAVNGWRSKELYTYAYLEDVHYRVRFRLDWNRHQRHLADDRNEAKHKAIMDKWILRGGKCAPFLGVSECPAVIRPEKFGSPEDGEGFYDRCGRMDMGVMFHSWMWGTEYGSDMLRKSYWRAVMNNGIINFPHPEDAIVERVRRLDENERKMYGATAI